MNSYDTFADPFLRGFSSQPQWQKGQGYYTFCGTQLGTGAADHSDLGNPVFNWSAQKSGTGMNDGTEIVYCDMRMPMWPNGTTGCAKCFYGRGDDAFGFCPWLTQEDRAFASRKDVHGTTDLRYDITDTLCDR